MPAASNICALCAPVLGGPLRTGMPNHVSCRVELEQEHLAAVEIMKLKHIIILQNKIDLVKEVAAEAQHEDIKRFIQV